MQAIFFDLFETLITEKTRPDFATRPPFHQRLRCTLEQVSSWWKENEEATMIGQFRDDGSRLYQLCREVDSPLTDAEIHAVAQEQEAWKQKVLSSVDARLIQTVETLRQAGLLVGIISNAMSSETRAWSQCPLRDVVDDAVFSCEVGAMKPRADIYTLALDRLGVDPSKALFVGDGGYDELLGAAAVGMTPVQAAWYLCRELDWPDGVPHRRIDSIDDLENVVWPIISPQEFSSRSRHATPTRYRPLNPAPLHHGGRGRCICRAGSYPDVWKYDPGFQQFGPT